MIMITVQALFHNIERVISIAPAEYMYIANFRISLKFETVFFSGRINSSLYVFT